MGDITFDTLYRKSLKVVSNNSIEYKDVTYSLNEKQQIEYLKKLGRLGLDNFENKIHVYNKIIGDINFIVYMIKVPYINESVNENISVAINNVYRTAIMMNKTTNEGIWSIDNILLYQDENFEIVENKYNELHNIISNNNLNQILAITNSAIDKEISKCM